MSVMPTDCYVIEGNAATLLAVFSAFALWVIGLIQKLELVKVIFLFLSLCINIGKKCNPF
jgi:hypothetical protein